MRENWGYIVSLSAVSAAVHFLHNELCSDPFMYDLYLLQKTAEIKVPDAVIIDVSMSWQSNI